jgi:hypothetical protein
MARQKLRAEGGDQWPFLGVTVEDFTVVWVPLLVGPPTDAPAAVPVLADLGQSGRAKGDQRKSHSDCGKFHVDYSVAGASAPLSIFDVNSPQTQATAQAHSCAAQIGRMAGRGYLSAMARERSP